MVAHAAQVDAPIETVLSLVTGVVLKQHAITEIHQLAEHVLGHPLWTHELADQAVWDRMRELLTEQYPQLKDVEPFAGKDSPLSLEEYLAQYVARQREKYGVTLSIARGEDERIESPVDSFRRIAPNKPIMVLTEKDMKNPAEAAARITEEIDTHRKRS